MLWCLCALALFAGACSSSTDSDTSTASDDGAAGTETDDTESDEADVEEPEESDDDSAGQDDAEPSDGGADGEEIVVYSILDENEGLGQFFPEIRAALEAGAAYINDNDGLGGSGRPIRVEFCVGEVDANQNAECAREIVESDAIANVGSAICTNDTAYPILNEASPPVPNIGALSCLPSTFTSPNSFHLHAGIQGAVVVSASLACNVLETEKTITTLVAIDSILATGPLYDNILAANGCEPSERIIEMGRDQFDGVPIVAQYGDADVALTLVAPPQPAPLVTAAQQQGVDTTMVFIASNFSSAIIENTGEASDGVVIARWFRAPDSGVPGWEVYSEYLEAAGGIEYLPDAFGTSAWASMLALDQAYRDCSDCEYTRAGAQQALDSLSGFDAMGMGPMIDFTTEPSHPLVAGCDGGEGPCFSRIQTLQGFAGIVENGELVTLGDGEPVGIPG